MSTKSRFDTVTVSPTRRETSSEFAKRWQMQSIGYTLPFQPIIDIDLSKFEARIAASSFNLAAPYGRRPGSYRLSGPITAHYAVRTVSGNAHQRRLQARRWRRQGFIVQPHRE